MNKPAKIETVTVGVHRKLSAARQAFHALELKKSGKNTFAGYSYFELADFLVPALKVFDDVGLGATVSFTADTATMTIVDLDNPEDRIAITSPMGSAALKGCHEVQNIGAVETYQRRYLWVAALEIIEHDALDKTTGKDAPERPTTGETPPNKRVKLDGAYSSPTALRGALKTIVHNIEGFGDLGDFIGYVESAEVVEALAQCRRDMPDWWHGGENMPAEFEPLEMRLARRKRELEETETLRNRGDEQEYAAAMIGDERNNR
jgi:hypothetical protein